MPADQRPGFELPLLLLGAFKSVIDELHQELAERGHGDARPVHGFALQAIGPGGTTISELGRQLGVSKQAAAKTVSALERAGYVRRERNRADGRAVQLKRTARGEQMLALSAAYFDAYHDRLAATLGADRLFELEDSLQRMVGSNENYLSGLPGWIT